MNKLFSILLCGVMFVSFSACEPTTTEVYQITMITDDLEGATATVSKTDDIRFADEVTVTLTPEKSYAWESNPEVTASNAICKSSTEKDGVCTYVFTSFEDNSVIYVTGVAVLSNHNGHDYVNLGLPSGTLWATCNIGATTPEDYGDYFAWGETKTKSEYNWSTYKYCNGSYDTLTKYCTDSSSGIVDNKTTLESSDDAATANWGGDWRMPTLEEQIELFSKCTWSWTENHKNTGVAGRIVTGPNGNSIFLPAAGNRDETGLNRVGAEGFYWSSSLIEQITTSACGLFVGLGYGDSDERYRGRSVRPVCSSR